MKLSPVVPVHMDTSIFTVQLGICKTILQIVNSMLWSVYGKEKLMAPQKSAHTKSDIDSCVHILKRANEGITSAA